MTDNRISLTELPQLVQSKIIHHLNRASLNALCSTNRSLHNFITSNNFFCDNWPQLDALFCEQDRREIVHLTKSPDNKKLCAVIREYNKDGTLLVFDIKRGPISKCKVNDDFCPVFSPDGSLIIVGAPNNDRRGLLVGRISFSACTRARTQHGCEVINWSKCFSSYEIRGAAFINRTLVWISHRSGGSEPRLSPCRVYSFMLECNPRNRYGITKSHLSASPFEINQNHGINDFDMNVDVIHKYPYSAINIHCFWTRTKSIIMCKHMDNGTEFEITDVPLNPRLNVSVGLGMSIAFSSKSNSLVGAGSDMSTYSGRLVTFYDEEAGHCVGEGPYQNFCHDLYYFDHYGSPKIWYYDGNILVYSRRMINEHIDQYDPDETQLTNEEKNILEWDESRFSSPRAFYVRGKVPSTIKDRVNIEQANYPFVTLDYADQCTLKPFLEGWTPVMWNLILNGAMYD